VQFADKCAPVTISSSAEYSVLQALQFQEVSVRLLSKVTPRYVTLVTRGISRLFSCNTSSGTESSGEIYCLSFPFIFLYIPVLTPRIHWSEAALQFAENTTFVILCREQVPSPNRARWVPGAAGPSFVYRLYSTGAMTEPWGTPVIISFRIENSHFTETLTFR
jgi:hypothetical protein